ncbi:hypothetical protein KIPB_002963 [Kipferlia bialata]|uniref:Uncharacterized protein n=1 Tax=Kipferlia bialata TaxID=797122 RepID=A0A9K3CT85_9EUKA|nr:hypothetical protein KIPB_002963 [Kipferlia bialata]|eukprot:g2963.t1
MGAKDSDRPDVYVQPVVTPDGLASPPGTNTIILMPATKNDEIEKLKAFVAENHGKSRVSPCVVWGHGVAMPVGARVRRGPDWMYDDQDGEIGLGYITQAVSGTDGTVMVVWDEIYVQGQVSNNNISSECL